MKLQDGTVISKAEVSPYKFGGDPMAEYLHYLAGMSAQDCQTGDVEWHYWVAQFGKRLLFENSQGFVWVHRGGSVAEAEDLFNEIDRDYSEWSSDDGDAETWEEEG